VEVVVEYGERFSADERTGADERALRWLFDTFPANVEPRQVLIKVVALNSLYHTNIFAVTEMAKHICSRGIDRALAVGDPAVVDRIAKFPFTGDRHYSFATKYCSWHQPERFPIYDNLVERLLWSYQRHLSFDDFSREELQDYPRYIAVIQSFIRRFGLGAMTFRQVDKFLWLHARELYPPKKRPPKDP